MLPSPITSCKSSCQSEHVLAVEAVWSRSFFLCFGTTLKIHKGLDLALSLSTSPRLQPKINMDKPRVWEDGAGFKFSPCALFVFVYPVALGCFRSHVGCSGRCQGTLAEGRLQFFQRTKDHIKGLPIHGESLQSTAKLHRHSPSDQLILETSLQGTNLSVLLPPPKTACWSSTQKIVIAFS